MSNSVARQHLHLLLARSGAKSKPDEAAGSAAKPAKSSSKGNSGAAAAGRKASSVKLGQKRPRDESIANPFVAAVDSKDGSANEIAKQIKRAAQVVGSGSGELSFATAAVTSAAAKAEKTARSTTNRNLELLLRSSKTSQAVKAKVAEVASKVHKIKPAKRSSKGKKGPVFPDSDSDDDD